MRKYFERERMFGGRLKSSRGASAMRRRRNSSLSGGNHTFDIWFSYFDFYAWSLVRSFSTQFKPAMGKSYVCILLLFSILAIQTSVCFIPFETLPQYNYSVLIASTLLSPSSNPKKKSSNPIKHSSILLLKINPLRFFPIISDQK